MLLRERDIRRVETCFPIEEKRLMSRLIADGLEVYLEDNVQAWILSQDGKYKRARPGKERARSAQEILLERLCDAPVGAPLSLLAPGASEAQRIRAAEALEEKLRSARRTKTGSRGRAGKARRTDGKSPTVLEPHRPSNDPPAQDEGQSRRRA